MPKLDSAQEYETPPPLTKWGRVGSFFLIIPCGAGSTFVLLALLATFGVAPPRESMLEVAFKVFVGVLLIYGPFWKILRREFPLMAGLAFGALFTISAWWLIYIG